MQGVQLLNIVPQEPGPPPTPKVPRPTGFFDQICFCNASPVDVQQVDYELSGPGGTVPGTLPTVPAGQFAIQTLNLDQGQFHFVTITIVPAGGAPLVLPTFTIHDKANWYLGRIHAGVAGEVGGANAAPFAFLTLFPDDPASSDITVQTVPHGHWT